MNIFVFFCLIIGVLANTNSSKDDIDMNMNMLHARRLAASSLRSTMSVDKCLPYALCLLGTMDIQVKGHKDKFPTWAHGLFETVLPLLEKFSEVKPYMQQLKLKTKEKIESLVEKAENLFNDEDEEDNKTFRHLLASYKVGRKLSSRHFCPKLFACPSDVTEDLNKSNVETKEVVSNEASEDRGRFLSSVVRCPSAGAKFCGAFWLACNFNGLVGAGIPANACNFLAIFCNGHAYACREQPTTTAPINAAPTNATAPTNETDATNATAPPTIPANLPK